MKRALVLTLIMVLAVAGIASAEAKLGGEFKVEYVIDTDNDHTEAGTGSVKAPLTLKAIAEEEGVWKAEAELKADADKPEALEVGEWSMNLTDELFVADLWGGGIEKSKVKSPLEFIEAGKTGTDDKARLRVTSDVLGYVDLTLDYDYNANDMFVFAEKALDEVTVGANVKKNLVNEGVRGTAHVKYVYGPATITGEAGLDNTKEDKDNTLLGGKVDYKFDDKLSFGAKVTRKAENITDGGELLLEPSVTYTEDLFKVGGTYTWKDDLENKNTKATNKIAANVTYRSNEDVDFDDLFDDYDTLTGYAAFAEAAYTTAKGDKTDDKNPTTELTVKGAASAVPDMVWVYGEFNYASDKDEDVEEEDFQFIIGNDSLTEDTVLFVKDYFKVNGEATVKLTERVKVIPTAKYGKWNTLAKTTKSGYEIDGKKDDYNNLTAKDVNELELGAGLTYALSTSSEIGISYTNRSQKFTEAKGYPLKELNDSFAKVYFKTSF